MRKNLIYAFAVALLSGCSTMSPETSNIKVYYLQSNLPAGCEELGSVTATAVSMLGQDSANATAKSQLIEKAYEMYGANTLLVSGIGEMFVSVNHKATAEGTAYNCPN